MKILNKVIYWLTELEKYGCMLAIGAMFLIGSLEVISRNFFSKSFIWSQELIVVFLVWEVFLAAAYIYNTGSLISVDFLYANVGPRVQKVFDVIIDLVSFIVIIVAIWFGWQFQAVQSKFLTNALRLPQNIHSIPLVICGISMLLHLIQKYLSGILERGGRDSV